VVLLRGHGLTSTGSSVAQAVLRAVSIDTLAGLSLRILAAGGTLADVPEADMAELPDLGDTFNQATAWHHEVARLGETSQP
jgi:3,4-dihydroxyphthalate decarboxylase